jgi:hypothetical protein
LIAGRIHLTFALTIHLNYDKVKKAIYSILIMSSMGSTIAPQRGSEKNTRVTRMVVDQSQTGYLEVNSPASYTLTAGY